MEDPATARGRLGEPTEELWSQAYALAPAAGDDVARSRVLRHMGLAAVWVGRTTDALRLFGEAEVAARYASRLDLAIRVRVTKGMILVSLGQSEEGKAAGASGDKGVAWSAHWAMAILVGGPAVALLATAGWLAVRAPTVDPKRVLVGLFEDRTGDPALADLVRQVATEVVAGLASTGLVQPIDAQVVTVEGARARDYPSLRPLARRVGAGSVVSGSISRRADSLEFQITLTDVATGDLLRPVPPVVRLASEQAAVTLVAQRVMAGYAAHFDPRFHNYATVSQPATYDAYREFQTAIRLSEQSHWLDSARSAEVLQHFRRAIALDSAFMAPRIMVGNIHAIWGECSITDSVAATLRTVGTHLLSADQARADVDVAFCHKDPRAQFAAAQQLYRAAPELAENVWEFALAASRDGKPREVLTCLERLERIHAAVPYWREVCWNLMTHAYHALGQYNEALQLSERMRGEFPDNALLERYQMRQWAALGDVARVNALIDRRIQKSSHEVVAGEDMLLIGEELRGHGHRAAGRALCERGVEWYATRPSSQHSTIETRGSVARLLYCAELWDQARVAYEHLATEDSSETRIGFGWGNQIAVRTRLGALAARRGDSIEVARVDMWLAARDSVPSAMYGRAVLAGFRGDHARALALLRVAWDGTDDAHTDPLLEPMRDYPPFRALLYPKK